MTQMCELTIVTATYNRCEKLKKAYSSLCTQGNAEFVWLIVDDGSSDDTYKTVQSWIGEKKINIKYIYQENSGVTLARHIGRMHVDTYWMTTLDSDDYYCEEALEKIIAMLDDRVKKDSKCMGLLFPVANNDTSDIVEGNYTVTQQYYDNGCVGEFQLVVKTDQWNRFQPPHFIGEKFITESSYLRQIDSFFCKRSKTRRSDFFPHVC